MRHTARNLAKSSAFKKIQIRCCTPTLRRNDTADVTVAPTGSRTPSACNPAEIDRALTFDETCAIERQLVCGSTMQFAKIRYGTMVSIASTRGTEQRNMFNILSTNNFHSVREERSTCWSQSAPKLD